MKQSCESLIFCHIFMYVPYTYKNKSWSGLKIIWKNKNKLMPFNFASIQLKIEIIESKMH